MKTEEAREPESSPASSSAAVLQVEGIQRPDLARSRQVTSSLRPLHTWDSMRTTDDTT